MNFKKKPLLYKNVDKQNCFRFEKNGKKSRLTEITCDYEHRKFSGLMMKEKIWTTASMKSLFGRQKDWMFRHHQSELVGWYKSLINKVTTLCSDGLQIMTIGAAEQTGLPGGCVVIWKSLKWAIVCVKDFFFSVSDVNKIYRALGHTYQAEYANSIYIYKS